MTETSETPPEFAPPEALPGLEPPREHDSALRKAAHRTIVALEAAGYLDETHAVITQLILDLADRVAHAKDYAAAALGAQLIAAYAVLVPVAEGGGNDEWTEFQRDIRQLAMEAIGRSAAEVRDAADSRPQE